MQVVCMQRGFVERFLDREREIGLFVQRDFVQIFLGRERHPRVVCMQRGFVKGSLETDHIQGVSPSLEIFLQNLTIYKPPTYVGCMQRYFVTSYQQELLIGNCVDIIISCSSLFYIRIEMLSKAITHNKYYLIEFVSPNLSEESHLTELPRDWPTT